MPAAGWTQIRAHDASCALSQGQSPGTAAAAGDFGVQELASVDPAVEQMALAAEIADGRVAARATIRIFLQAGRTGSA